MPDFTLNESNPTSEIDLGNSQTLTVTNVAGAVVRIYIDYESNGIYTSAIKGNAGYGNPFVLRQGQSKAVPKTDLESEHVRVGVEGLGAQINFNY